MKTIQTTKVSKIKRNLVKRINNYITRQEEKLKEYEGTTKEVKK